MSGTGGANAACGKEFDCSMRQKQREQSKQHPAGMETPGQQNPSYEDGIIRKLNYVAGNCNPSRAEQNFSQEEEDTPRDQQRFQRAFAPNLHAEETPFLECSAGLRQLSLAQRFRGEWRTRYRERLWVGFVRV